MSILDQAAQTQINNIQKKTGKSLDEFVAPVKSSDLTKHGEVRVMLKRELYLGHGDANALTHVVLQSDGASAAQGKSETEVLDEIYSGKKAAPRSIHDALWNTSINSASLRTCLRRATSACAERSSSS